MSVSEKERITEILDIYLPKREFIQEIFSKRLNKNVAGVISSFLYRSNTEIENLLEFREEAMYSNDDELAFEYISTLSELAGAGNLAEYRKYNKWSPDVVSAIEDLEEEILCRGKIIKHSYIKHVHFRDIGYESAMLLAAEFLYKFPEDRTEHIYLF